MQFAMKSLTKSRAWFVALQYVGLPLLFLLSVVSQPPGMSQQTGMFIGMAILFIWAISSVILAEVNYRKAEVAKRQQEQFTADVSHDLRTPVAALRTLLEVSQLDPKLQSHKPSQEVFARALTQVDTMTAMTDRLLRLSRFETTTAPRLEPIKLHPLVMNAYTQLEPLAKEKQQTIKLSIDENLSVYAAADELIQLLTILLDNAIKFSPKRSIIDISTKKQRSHILLSVRDSGCGLTPDEQKYVFNRFYRTDKARQKTDKTSGFGLGLAIAAAIARRHKNKITVNSQPNQGATFSIRLKQA